MTTPNHLRKLLDRTAEQQQQLKKLLLRAEDLRAAVDGTVHEFRRVMLEREMIKIQIRQDFRIPLSEGEGDSVGGQS